MRSGMDNPSFLCVNGLGSSTFLFFYFIFFVGITHSHFQQEKRNLHFLTNSKMIEREKNGGWGRGLASSGDAFWQALCRDWGRANSENKLLPENRLCQSGAANPAARYQSLGAPFQNDLCLVRLGGGKNTRGCDANPYLELVAVD